MKMQKGRIADLLTKMVFIPDSQVLVVNLFRQLLKRIFRFVGKLAALILL